MATKNSTQLLAYLLMVGTLGACSFHPARRVFKEGIIVEAQEASPLSIVNAKIFEDGEALCVEGTVISLNDTHSSLRGGVIVSVIDSFGSIIETTRGCFSSTEEPRRYRLQKKHTYSERRFDIALASKKEKVVKIKLSLDPNDKECKL